MSIYLTKILYILLILLYCNFIIIQSITSNEKISKKNLNKKLVNSRNSKISRNEEKVKKLKDSLSTNSSFINHIDYENNSNVKTDNLSEYKNDNITNILKQRWNQKFIPRIDRIQILKQNIFDDEVKSSFEEKAAGMIRGDFLYFIEFIGTAYLIFCNVLFESMSSQRSRFSVRLQSILVMLGVKILCILDEINLYNSVLTDYRDTIGNKRINENVSQHNDIMMSIINGKTGKDITLLLNILLYNLPTWLLLVGEIFPFIRWLSLLFVAALSTDGSTSSEVIENFNNLVIAKLFRKDLENRSNLDTLASKLQNVLHMCFLLIFLLRSIALISNKLMKGNVDFISLILTLICTSSLYQLIRNDSTLTSAIRDMRLYFKSQEDKSSSKSMKGRKKKKKHNI